MNRRLLAVGVVALALLVALVALAPALGLPALAVSTEVPRREVAGALLGLLLLGFLAMGLDWQDWL